ncbi:hypothetical protein [Streptomyces chartreusis]
MLPATADDDVPTFNQISPMTPQAILDDCESGVGKCTFNDPQYSEPYLGDFHVVSDLAYNCSSSPSSQGVMWADTVGTQDTAGGSISASAGILGIITTSVEATYSHTWLTQQTVTDKTDVTIQPGEVGWVERAQWMQDVTGTLQTHYDEPRYGHYYWYLTETVTAPVPKGPGDMDKNRVITQSRPMTDEELAACK